ncbi:hypothetical protein ROJ8625_00434 [Roseivivax jejudonensis]|uniref:Uncharacterized protein n=1 Tax=Roseivivax jejudonensis TaxID=1529041 RepID=A0A1X6Y916_9RHOB|nr:hypothetical protein [Roseivivax jejudonensis]SLN13939.1 hypothetical protein ROJ8625_00434 [Roseivivax jejudonensis]
MKTRFIASIIATAKTYPEAKTAPLPFARGQRRPLAARRAPQTAPASLKRA